jgi:predicted CXXCH cytochrome family protein
MKNICAALFLILLTTGIARGTPLIEIIVPGEHVSLERSRISVVGHSTAPVVRLYLNGEFEAELVVRDNVFHTSVRLPYGLNEIRVVPVDDNNRENASAQDAVEVLCGPRVSREQGRLFAEYRFHSSEQPAVCLDCHTGDADGTPGAGGAEWCYPCHNTVRQRLRAHTVEDIRPCTGCHRIRQDLTAESFETTGGENPCFQCHSDKVGLLEEEYVHGPVAGGACTICHDPHGSDYASTLVSPVPVLCETCHDQLSGENKPVQHYPFLRGWCIDCHDPHATSNKWVLVKKGRDLCLNCHLIDGTQRAHRHPYGVKPKNKLAVPLTLGEDGKLECLSCHEPHAARANDLLRSDRSNVCLGCHPGIED